MMKRLVGAMLVAGGLLSGGAAEQGSSVVVVYNKNLPASKQLAEHYAGRRGVPERQLFGVDVEAGTEVMSRADFRDKIEGPLSRWLYKEKLFAANPKKRTAKDTAYRPMVDASIRYVVLCYGIPLKIARDLTLKEDGAEKVQEPLRARNEAAVDADLALLPAVGEKLLLSGVVMSPFYLATNHTVFHPTNGILMVARLDGPTFEMARDLVDKAIEAESNGLWGRAYIDSRGITNGEYKPGDDWMRASSVITRRMGYETEHDEREATFPVGYPMSQVAFYAGWYDAHPSGPFTRPQVEFMPGAFAYHLHSFSAHTLRATNQYWVGPLVAKGATITMGCVDEPYLTGTPNVAAVLDRLMIRGWSFGEAAYAAQSALSWQTTVVGDPLYRPFGRNPQALHMKLEQAGSPLVEWSHARVVGLNEGMGTSPAEVIQYIQGIPTVATNSAVLQEKLGQLLLQQKEFTGAAAAYERAAQLKPSPQQLIRVLNALGDLQLRLRRDQQAIETFQRLLKLAPDYYAAVRVNRDLAALSRNLGKTEDAARFEQEAQRLMALPK